MRFRLRSGRLQLPKRQEGSAASPVSQGGGTHGDVFVFDLAGTEELLDRGREALKAGDRERALQLFERAVHTCPIPAAINNLALMVLEQRNDPTRALQILQPNLHSPGDANPFAHATAARCYHRLGEMAPARQHLEVAIQAFDRGLRKNWSASRTPWLEYTSAILHAAGTLEDDRLAWELYRRWSACHVLPQSHYFGGIAAFNVRRFPAAARTWRRLADRWEKWRFASAFAYVAELCEDGLVPPFRLFYDVPRMDAFKAELKRARSKPDRIADLVRRISQDPLQRVLMLASAFDLEPRDPEYAQMSMVQLVANNGEWGERLARSVLLSGRTTAAQKMDAARGLLKAGVIQMGQSLRMNVDGRVQEVTFREVPVEPGPDPELDQRLQEAIRLRDAGQVAQAKRVLEEMVGGERVYLPAAVTYANLLRREGRLGEARKYLELAARVLPHNPAVLFNLAGLSVEEGDLDQAARLLSRIRTDDPKILALVRELRARIRRLRGR